MSRSDALIRFREAIDRGDVDGALAAAQAAGGLPDLADSLALVLALAGAGDPDRYERAVARWLVRLQQTVALPWEDRERCARALHALGEGRAPEAAADDLAAVLASHAQHAAASVAAEGRWGG